jgi:hypothetical protein
MARTGRWYDDVAPSTAVVLCSGEQHRVTWRRGKVVLEDHDLSAEQALLALGGERCTCMLVLKMWRDQWLLPPEMFKTMSSWLGPKSFLAPAALERPRQLSKVRNWERSWRRSSCTDKHGTLLEEDLVRLATGAWRDYIARSSELIGRARPSIELRMARPGQPATVIGGVDGRRVYVNAAMGHAWIVDVWGRDISVVGDGFVLEVLDEEPPRSMVVRAAGWEMAPGQHQLGVRLARVERNARGRWSLTWINEPSAPGSGVAACDVDDPPSSQAALSDCYPRTGFSPGRTPP